ncbi:MAG: peptidyl-prolyl cis-trans isomerase [Deferribacterales bacterium]|nr:peptidyl-prolyl cis-trans isomerase [Deferribacterales bacterium]
MKKIFLTIGLILTLSVGAAFAAPVKVLMETNYGNIELELYPDKAPQTVKNFVSYAKDGHYDGLIFHRVIKDFMIQGGGFDENMKEKPTKAPIPNEAYNGLKNERGTIAMARTNDPHSATSQFFINHKTNSFLNYKAQTTAGWGYAVFGKVINGMDVVDKIAGVETGSLGYFQDVPTEKIIIKKVTVSE